MPTEPQKRGLEFEATVVQPAALADAQTSPLGPTPAGQSRVVSTRHAGATPVGTPEAALEQDELERTRIFLRLTLALAIAVLAPLPLLGGDPLAKGIFASSAVMVAIAGAWMLWVLAAPELRYAEWKKAAVGIVCGGCGCAGIYYWGIFSPASLILGFGVYFVSPQGTLASGLLVYGQCALFQLGLSVAVYTGAIADRGLIHPAPFGVLDFVVLEAIVQGIFLASFVFARASRATALRAIGQLEKTVREASRREALLLEAKQDLARALRVGAPGRYTDQSLGSFTLGVLIGHGGMGEVYEARHARSGEVAAVKMLHRHLLVDSEQVERFVREATAVRSLRSDHVVRVLEVSDPAAAVPYLAMERLVGRDLADLLRDQPRLDPAGVSELVVQVARGVTAAHEAGIIHRDLKPQNVFRAEVAGSAPVWKVLDFGVSKFAGHSGTLTRDQIIGTPAYMAPEQALGKKVDARTDVYALAAIAYRALTGQAPYNGTDAMALLLESIHRMPVRPRLLAQDIPEEVERVLVLGLAKKPEDRFSTPVEFATALEGALKGETDARTSARATALLAVQPWAVLPVGR